VAVGITPAPPAHPAGSGSATEIDADTGPVPRLGPAAVRVGSLLRGRYRLTTLIGRGGMADVYRAVDQVIGRSVAIKVFRPGSDAVTDRQRFLGEIRTIAGLAHPNLVALYDGGQQDARPWCVMTYVDGGTLADIHPDPAEPGLDAVRPDGRPATAQWIAHVGAQIADALAYIHDRGIVHRDVKPSNVLLDRAGDAYLSDFGVAQMVDATRLTATGALLGTAAYLSPEQVLGRPATPAVDVYALALVLLEALTGEREFPGTAVESAVARLSRDPQVPDHLGPDWAELLHAMTAVEPAGRPDAAAVASWLGSLASRPVPRLGPIPAPRTVTRLPAADPQTVLRAAVSATTLTPRTPTADPSPGTAPTTVNTRAGRPAPPGTSRTWHPGTTGLLWRRVTRGVRRNLGRSAGIAATSLLAVLTAWQISALGPTPVRVGDGSGRAGSNAVEQGLNGGGLVAPSTAPAGDTIGAVSGGLGRAAGARRALPAHGPAPGARTVTTTAPVKVSTVSPTHSSTSASTSTTTSPSPTRTTPPATTPSPTTTTAVPPPTDPAPSDPAPSSSSSTSAPPSSSPAGS